VLLGLGTPLQETTALAWQQAATAPLLWCVGGLFDYWAGTRTRAPRVVRACRLEWLWRLVLHPGAMWRRTLVEGPWLLARIRRERV
jgi:exopolysaccharide biosynthesis WecB/TagA/CpsF family protein